MKPQDRWHLGQEPGNMQGRASDWVEDQGWGERRGGLGKDPLPAQLHTGASDFKEKPAKHHLLRKTLPKGGRGRVELAFWGCSSEDMSLCSLWHLVNCEVRDSYTTPLGITHKHVASRSPGHAQTGGPELLKFS